LPDISDFSFVTFLSIKLKSRCVQFLFMVYLFLAMKGFLSKNLIAVGYQAGE